ncbi:OTU domain-containing protein 4 [Brachionichthys hirsutus]|uniref:OTU domain-containing protein 4 n=1 Tax=Brachionichthys hirsutus TaxID=412623 RepID=UPI003604AC72
MDDGGNPHSNNEERDAEKSMDDYLKSIGLHRKKIAKDGSCLFRVVAEQVLHCQSLHTTVRAKCVAFLRRNREQYEAFIEGDFDSYVDKLQDPQQWVGEVEINALAVMYRRDFLIFQEPGKPAVNITGNNFEEKVLLCFLNRNHYDSIYPISHLENAALCQSVLYELLYERVFHISQSLLGARQRTPRPSDLPIDDNMAACDTSDESDGDAGEPLWIENEAPAPRHTRGRGRGRHLPERVRRSLNPTLFRNIEYDVWLKSSRAQQKMDYCIAAGMQFSAGDRCRVCLEASGRSYTATVKEVPPNNGLVSVYIEELGKRQVPLWRLRPLSDENSWSTVVGRDKRLSNGHGDWEERGKGRGRGKHIPASSVSPAMAPGCGGRVQEQGGPKASRKTASSAPAGLHLPKREEEKKKEEEEVDIQLADERSFPALERGPGQQGDGGRNKGEKKRSQRNRMASSGGVRASPPPAGERPPSPGPPEGDTGPPPPIHPPASPASTPNTKMAAAPVASGPPPGPVSPSNKTSAPSYALAAGATPKTQLSATGGAAPPSPTIFLSPVLPAASLPPILNTHSSSSPPSSSLSRIPSSPPPPSLPPPTSIAPSPGAVQGFYPPSPLPRSAPSLSTSPPLCSSSSAQISSSSSSSSSSHSRHAAHVHEAPAKTSNSVKDVGVALTAPHTFPNPASLPQAPPLAPPLESPTLNQREISVPQTRSLTPPVQHQPQPPPHQLLPQSHAEGASVPRFLSHPAVEESHPHPSLSPPRPSHQTPDTQTGTGSPAPPQQVPLPHPFHPQTITGAVPLQRLSLYLDPLYPGFPLGEKGDVAPTPPFSSSKVAEDLPRDPNVLRFFFNLGVKAYSMPLCPPCIYLLPLQQDFTVHPRHRSPTPPTRHEEPPPRPHYPQTSSMPPPYEHQPTPSEPPQPGDLFTQAGYPIIDRVACPVLPWQQHHMPPARNGSFAVGYPAPYPVPQTLTRGYHPQYPVFSPPPMGYWSPAAREDLLLSQGAMEPPQHANGDASPGLAPAASSADANSRRGAPLKFFPSAPREEQEEILTGGVLLVDPPLNNNPILVSNPGVKDVPVSMTTMKPSGIPGSPSSYDFVSKAAASVEVAAHGYHGHHNPNAYASRGGAPEPSQGGSLSNMAESLSVGCSTEEDWEEQTGFKPATFNPRGARRIYRAAARGRGSYDPGRGAHRRRYAGDMGAGYNFVQYNSSYRGRGRERGY